jgi:hypothetical protein
MGGGGSGIVPAGLYVRLAATNVGRCLGFIVAIVERCGCGCGAMIPLFAFGGT